MSEASGPPRYPPVRFRSSVHPAPSLPPLDPKQKSLVGVKVEVNVKEEIKFLALDNLPRKFPDRCHFQFQKAVFSNSYNFLCLKHYLICLSSLSVI